MIDGRHALPRLILASLVCGLLLFSVSCGRKAPPRAPKARPLPVARNLTAKVHGGRVVLTWELMPLESRLAKDARFALYRDELPLGAGACATCPPRYQLVAQVPYDPETNQGKIGHIFQYSETVADGFRYRYQVALRLTNGRQGEPSKTVEVMLD
jgi:hypothetical protein